MPAPSPESPVSALDAAELELYRRLDEAALADEPISLSREDSDTARLVITELADRRRLGAFYGLSRLGQAMRDTRAAAEDQAPATLADARDAIRADLIDLALNGGGIGDSHADADALDHLTAALERVERLIDLDAARGATAVDPELDHLRDVAGVARDVLNTVADDLTREHFTGRFERLYRDLESLSEALESAGA